MRPRTFLAMGSAIVLLGVAAPLPAVPRSSPGPDYTAHELPAVPRSSPGPDYTAHDRKEHS